MNDELTRKVNRAVHIIKSVHPTAADPIEVAYSGGKDSDVILRLTQMAGVPYRAIYKNTTIDPPGTIRHCRENGVEVMRPKATFFQLIRKKGMPDRFRRFCCAELKEYPILRNVVLGIRRSESTKRAKRYKEPIECRVWRGGVRTQQVLPHPRLDKPGSARLHQRSADSVASAILRRRQYRHHASPRVYRMPARLAEQADK